MTDLSASLTRAFARHLEIGGYRGNRGNPVAETNDTAVSRKDAPVATGNAAVATVATKPSARSSIHPEGATVATGGNALATGHGASKVAENRGSRGPVATVATVATAKRNGLRDATADSSQIESVELLRPVDDGWSVADWLAFYNERAAIAEFDGGLPRQEAEARAFACCVVEWLNRHPAASSPGRCAWCARPASPTAMILPFGTRPGTHAWLHAECWPAWCRARRADAAAALRAMGIEAAAPHQTPPELT